MPEVVMHPSSERQIDSVIKNMPSALLLVGPDGVGLRTIAEMIVKKSGFEKTVVLPERQEVVDVERGTITVQSIRHLYEVTKTKGVNRLIIIDSVERMGVVAQNAFLKLLEEPNDFTHFVLLAHNTSTLLPTILSRVQKIDIRPVSKMQSEKLLDNLNVTDQARRTQLLFIAEGLPAEIVRLTDEGHFTNRSAIVRDARDFVTGNTYDRAVVAHKYRDNRSEALLLINDALKQLKMTVEAKKDWSLLQAIDKLLETHRRIEANGNIRLQLTTALL